MLKKLNRVAIVGGCHGNEILGSYLVKKFERNPKLASRESFETVMLLANPRAFQEGRRYIHQDLNRIFNSENLNNPNPEIYESVRSKEIVEILGTRKNSKVDLIIDLHSTTSNMGLTVILGTDNDPFMLNLAAHLMDINPLVKCFRWLDTQKNYFLRSLCKRSIAIEVGAVAQNYLHPWYFEQTEKLIYTILDFLNESNQKTITSKSSQVTIYEGMQLIDYPRDHHGELSGMIHPQLISKDYQPLNSESPLFKTFGGETITYQGKFTVYPVFIGEAAYLEKGIAMCLCDRQIIPFKSNL